MEEVETAPAGDIVAVIGLKESATGDTLCDTAHPILLEAISFAEAVVSQSVEPDSGADKDKLGNALAMLQLEDPTFKVRADKDTGQTLMSGMGTLHLEVKKHRLERDFRLKVRVGKPRVSYRETLKTPKTVEVEVRTIGQRDVYAKLRVEFTNLKAAQAVTVTNLVTSDVLPALLNQAAEVGVRDALQTGEFGFPMMDVQARVLSAGFDPQLSTEDAFGRAAVEAYREATRDNVVLLEPIMALRVTTPDEFPGQRDRRPGQPGRPDRRHGFLTRRHHRGECPGAAGEAVRLRRPGAEPEPGAGRVGHGAGHLRAGPGRRGAGDARLTRGGRRGRLTRPGGRPMATAESPVTPAEAPVAAPPAPLPPAATDKEAVYRALARLPADVTLSDIIYELETLEAIRIGIASADAGPMTPHAEVIRRFHEWNNSR